MKKAPANAPKFYTAYGPRNRVSLDVFEPTLTQQNFQAECDINNILDKWQKTGIPPQEKLNPQYLDLVDASDYHTSLNQVIAAQNAFDALPSTLRTLFSNDPGAFLDFVNDPANAEKMVELGLTESPSSDSISTAPPNSAVGAEGSSASDSSQSPS